MPSRHCRDRGRGSPDTRRANRESGPPDAAMRRAAMSGYGDNDDGTTSAQMGRGALRVRVSVDTTAVDLVTYHLKSKLLSYHGNRFTPRDEGERERYAGYPLALRAAEAVTLRDYATGLLDG